MLLVAAAACLVLGCGAAVCCLSLLRRRLAQAVDVPWARGRSGLLHAGLVWYRWALGPCWGWWLAAAVRRRLAQQQQHKRSWSPAHRLLRPVVFFGDEEFDSWASLDIDMAVCGGGGVGCGPFVNAGVWGVTAGNMRWCCERLALAHLPRTVVLHVGPHDWDARRPCGPTDCPRTVAEALGSVLETLDLCWEYGTRDVRFLLTPLPPALDAGQREYMRLLHSKLEALCKNYDQCADGLRLSLLDLRADLPAADAEWPADRVYMCDGYHKTLHGHRLKARALVQRGLGAAPPGAEAPNALLRPPGARS